MAMSMRERVGTLEEALKELAYAGRKTEMSVEQLSEEMKDFKAQMAQLEEREAAAWEKHRRESAAQSQAFDERMAQIEEREAAAWEKYRRESAAQSQAFDERMAQLEEREAAAWEKYRRESAAQSQAFDDKMDKDREDQAASWEENKREHQRIYREWGELANKMGTLVQDMVAPNFPGILKRYFGIEELDDMLVYRRKPHPTDRSRRKEFDLIAWTSDTVFWSETKSKGTVAMFKEFVEDNDSLFEFFPELVGRNLIKIGAALYIPPDVVTYLSRSGCYAMMLGEETMELVNFDELQHSDN